MTYFDIAENNVLYLSIYPSNATHSDRESGFDCRQGNTVLCACLDMTYAIVAYNWELYGKVSDPRLL